MNRCFPKLVAVRMTAIPLILTAVLLAGGCSRDSGEISAASVFSGPSGASPLPESAAMDRLRKQVKEKMLHSNKHYTSLNGTLVSHYDKDDVTVRFQIRQGKKPAAYWLLDNPKDTTFTQIYDGRYLYQTRGKLHDPSVKELNEPGYEKERADKSGIPFGILDMPHPWEMAETLMTEPANWSITGTDTFLGRKAVVLEVVNDPHSPIPGKTLKLWVDEETGILLQKASVLDSNQELYVVARITELHVNGPLEEDKLRIPDGQSTASLSSPEAEEEDLRQAEAALLNLPFPEGTKPRLKSARVVKILHRETAYMLLRVEETLTDGSVSEQTRSFSKKNGKWING